MHLYGCLHATYKQEVQHLLLTLLFCFFPPLLSLQESARCVERKFWTPRTTNRPLCDSAATRQQLRADNGCEDETDVHVCHLVTFSVLPHNVILTVILPTYVKERDLEVALLLL